MSSLCVRLAVVAALAAGPYLPSLHGGLVFDDHEAIESNPDVRSNTPLSAVFSNDFWGLPLTSAESHKSFRPLTILSFRLNHMAHGMWLPGFHLANIALHCLVAVLFHLFCLRLGLCADVALQAALLFALHSVHTEAVANIVGRSEPLCAVFFLLALLCYQQSAVARWWLWAGLAVVLSLVSMLCKEQGLTALPLAAVYELLIACPLHWGAVVSLLLARLLRREPQQQSVCCIAAVAKTVKRTAILVLCAVAILAFRLYLNGRSSPFFNDSDNPASFSPHALTRLLTYCYLASLNLWLLLCPSQLCFDWSMGSIPLVESLTDHRNLATLATFASLATLLLALGVGSAGKSVGGTAKAKQHSNGASQNGCPSPKRGASSPNSSQSSQQVLACRRSLLALALLVVAFLPASNLAFPVGFVLAERVLYLPSLGLCLLVALGYSACQANAVRRLASPLLMLTLVAFSLKTAARSHEWTSTQRVAEAGLPVNPHNAKIFMTIGNTLAQQGNRSCEVFYRASLALRPNYTAAWTNLGLVLLNTGRPSEAERCYRHALSIKPDHVNANTNLAHLCRLQERWSEAATHYSTALERRPSNPALHYHLALVTQHLSTHSSSSSSLLQQSEAGFEQALSLQPLYWEAHAALAELLASSSSLGQWVGFGHADKERIEKAIGHFQRSLQIKPDSAEAHYKLGKLLLYRVGPRKAESELLAAVKLAPSHAQAHLELGRAYQALGREHEAKAQFETAGKLNHTLAIHEPHSLGKHPE